MWSQRLCLILVTTFFSTVLATDEINSTTPATEIKSDGNFTTENPGYHSDTTNSSEDTKVLGKKNLSTTQNSAIEATKSENIQTPSPYKNVNLPEEDVLKSTEVQSFDQVDDVKEKDVSDETENSNENIFAQGLFGLKGPAWAKTKARPREEINANDLYGRAPYEIPSKMDSTNDGYPGYFAGPISSRKFESNYDTSSVDEPSLKELPSPTFRMPMRNRFAGSSGYQLQSAKNPMNFSPGQMTYETDENDKSDLLLTIEKQQREIKEILTRMAVKQTNIEENVYQIARHFPIEEDYKISGPNTAAGRGELHTVADDGNGRGNRIQGMGPYPYANGRGNGIQSMGPYVNGRGNGIQSMGPYENGRGNRMQSMGSYGNGRSGRIGGMGGDGSGFNDMNNEELDYYTE